jgi:protein gp37
VSENTKIQWAHHTYNPWRGCRKVAPECANCYITSTPPFRMTGQTHGSVRVRAGGKALSEPLKWHAAAERAGERHRVFCLSLGDWLDDENVPIEWLADLLAMIQATPNLDWLLLTKRPQNWITRINMALAMCEAEIWEVLDFWKTGTPPANVWIGVSAGADQSAALAIPARVHFLSCEPMLHALDETHAAKFDWIILGGESGHNARMCGLGWIRDAKVFCQERGIACFVKQLGSNIASGGTIDHPKDKKGGDPSEWPEDIRVRQFPTPRAL